MPNKRQNASSCAKTEQTCGPRDKLNDRQTIAKDFAQKVRRVLKDQHVVVSEVDQERFIKHIDESTRKRKAVHHVWSKNRKENDIIGLIQIARDAGDMDEAIWRCFLAAHFGRASTNKAQVDSAVQLLCKFATKSFWTWQQVSSPPSSVRKGLHDHAGDLKTISYGNHRQFESKKAKDISKVIESFLGIAEQYGGPLGLVTVDPSQAHTDTDRFEHLYQRLSPIFRFGRTGRFDYLVLLNDLKLISAEPASCYLRDSSGPLDGAKRLWGKRPTNELEKLAADFAERLDVSPTVLEDCLCNWQKKQNDSGFPHSIS